MLGAAPWIVRAVWNALPDDGSPILRGHVFHKRIDDAAAAEGATWTTEDVEGAVVMLLAAQRVHEDEDGICRGVPEGFGWRQRHESSLTTYLYPIGCDNFCESALAEVRMEDRLWVWQWKIKGGDWTLASEKGLGEEPARRAAERACWAAGLFGEQRAVASAAFSPAAVVTIATDRLLRAVVDALPTDGSSVPRDAAFYEWVARATDRPETTWAVDGAIRELIARGRVFWDERGLCRGIPDGFVLIRPHADAYYLHPTPADRQPAIALILGEVGTWSWKLSGSTAWNVCDGLNEGMRAVARACWTAGIFAKHMQPKPQRHRILDGFTRAARYDDAHRRSIWYRENPDGSLEMRAGREGGDDHVRLAPGDVVTAKTLAALASLLRCNAWATEQTERVWNLDEVDEHVGPFGFWEQDRALNAEQIDRLCRANMVAGRPWGSAEVDMLALCGAGTDADAEVKRLRSEHSLALACAEQAQRIAIAAEAEFAAVGAALRKNSVPPNEGDSPTTAEQAVLAYLSSGDEFDWTYEHIHDRCGGASAIAALEHLVTQGVVTRTHGQPGEIFSYYAIAAPAKLTARHVSSFRSVFLERKRIAFSLNDQVRGAWLLSDGREVLLARYILMVADGHRVYVGVYPAEAGAGLAVQCVMAVPAGQDPFPLRSQI